MTLQAKAALSVVDLYLARGRLRAEISMQGFTRLSDLFNNAPGEFMGARQSGDALLRFADLNEDSRLLQHARRVAPMLLDRHPAAARAHVARWLGGKTDYLKA